MSIVLKCSSLLPTYLYELIVAPPSICIMSVTYAKVLIRHAEGLLKYEIVGVCFWIFVIQFHDG